MKDRKIQLDDTDMEILRILHRNARTPLKTIAEKVFVSAPTVASRIEALEKNGVIRGYHADINESALGHSIKAFINLEVAPDRQAELYPYLRNNREVIECCHVTGEYSYLIQTVFDSNESLEKYVLKLQTLGRTTTQIVFSSVVPYRGFEP